ncbi:alpha/beta fold hydrolase [Kaistia dalseonensis]|uniref:Alpha-beta hydrolase superfamily lysophospholipase n=1 Tax=Kaistia dalseonensis TaxID=410840 RepID=A0ABU0H5L5_9HYPH|nr:alpha/beta fold hydrolase [Kaistia dalseonensis]MCX5495019.1 alpha/beta fold hydrolase [Kaistia dalseonensis]MDQ0437600.1 alpha-beta hydrolase superfamily lysophospholipase [Kaistia dalseonensis]
MLFSDRIERVCIGSALRALATLLVLGLGLAAAKAQDAFYAASPTELVGKPGTLIRATPIVPPSGAAAAYRILYRSVGVRREPIAVSGIIIVPQGLPPVGGWPVVAWAHPTTGVAQHCAPSLDPARYDHIAGLADFLARGYVVAASDYPGLGTPGFHPYLVGDSQGRAVLDAVRAAMTMPQVPASPRVVPWGYSQGGHAALFAGQIAKSYAPTLQIVGIAASAPPTELGSLIRADVGSIVGRVLSAYALWSWSNVYGLPITSAIDKRVVLIMPRIADTCTKSAHDKLRLVLADQLFQQNSLLSRDVTTTQPWRDLIEGNTPGITPPGVPVFLAQGASDKIVRPLITELYSDVLCSRRRAVRFIMIPGANHEAMGKAATRQAVAWIADRFNGLPPPSDCEAQ